MHTGVKIADIMTHEPVTVSLKTTAEKCAQIMADEQVGSLIVKEGKELKGIITERDIVVKCVADNVAANSITSQEIMVSPVITVTPDEDIVDAIVLMSDNEIRHLPVVQGDQLVGLVTMKDILKIEPQLFDMIADRFELREEGRKLSIKEKPREGICQNCGSFTENLERLENQMLCEECRDEME